jgi:hypothetical protein
MFRLGCAILSVFSLGASLIYYGLPFRAAEAARESSMNAMRNTDIVIGRAKYELGRGYYRYFEDSSLILYKKKFQFLDSNNTKQIEHLYSINEQVATNWVSPTEEDRSRMSATTIADWKALHLMQKQQFERFSQDSLFNHRLGTTQENDKKYAFFYEKAMKKMYFTSKWEQKAWIPTEILHLQLKYYDMLRDLDMALREKRDNINPANMYLKINMEDTRRKAILGQNWQVKINLMRCFTTEKNLSFFYNDHQKIPTHQGVAYFNIPLRDTLHAWQRNLVTESEPKTGYSQTYKNDWIYEVQK